MKFEFQTENTVKGDKGTVLGRKFGKFLHVGTTGVRFETDTGGVVEVETGGWERKFSKLKALIDEAVAIIDDLNKKKGKGFPFSEQPRLRQEGLLKKGESLQVNITDSSFTAKIQASEGVALSGYGSLAREHEKPHILAKVVGPAGKILAAANVATARSKPIANTANLGAFLEMVVNYLVRGQEVASDVSKVSYAKFKFRLMNRTKFSAVFGSLLAKPEQDLFRKIVKNHLIESELGLDPKDSFFKGGYWGDLGKGQVALFQGGKIAGLATEDKKNIFDCTGKSVVKGSKAALNVKLCGARKPKTNITVGGWLNSIVSGPDILSPPAGGSKAMGRYGVETKGKHKGLVRFEIRGTVGHNLNRPASQWGDFVEEIFLEAATCRPGSRLKYDGAKKFDPKNCP